MNIIYKVGLEKGVTQNLIKIETYEDLSNHLENANNNHSSG